MRLIVLALVALTVAACRQDRTADEAQRLRPGEPGWTESTGEVSLTDGETMSFTITSERFKAWDAARQGIDQRVAARYGAILQAASPSRRNIERAVRYLASEPGAVASIQRAGMSVRDFVVTTVVLEQEMRLADARGEIPPDTMPTYPYTAHQPYPGDTSSVYTYTPTRPPDPMSPTPVVRQYLDTFPRPDTMTRRDTVVKRDTLVKRDSVKPPVDTLRDTIPARGRRI